MTPTLHIVTTCTDRKTVKAASALKLRSIPRVPMTERIDLWQEAIRGFRGEKVAARELYCGEQWSVASQLPQSAVDAGFVPRLWVASAGHGLVSGDTPIASYSATFARKHPDSVRPFGESPKEWWGALTSRKGARCISNLIQESENAYVLVICSASYFEALESDLRSAIGIDKSRVLIVSSAAIPGFESVIVRSDARLRSQLGGTLNSLNVRVARKTMRYIQKKGWDGDRVRKYVQRLVDACPPYERKVGRLLADHEVEVFIRRVRGQSLIGWTRAHALLRKSGGACAQVRFRQLFRRVERDS